MRPKRVEFPGAIYHVMQRGNNKELIFQTTNDKKFFIAELTNTKKMYDFQLYGYVLLDNHYHLLLQTGETPLSKIMQRLNSLYSRFYNREHLRSGHLFGLRYKSLLIQDERYLFAVLRYIHWNPIHAGLSETVADYKWSSDPYYRHGINGLVDTDFILNTISAKRKEAVAEYLKLIQEEAVEDYRELEKLARREEDEMQAKYSRLDQILKSTGVSNSDFGLIKEGKRLRSLSGYKKAFMVKAMSEGFRIYEVAEHINVTPGAVKKLTDSGRTQNSE